MIGEYVPRDCLKWKTFLLLRDLLFYVCAPAIDRGHVLVTSVLVLLLNRQSGELLLFLCFSVARFFLFPLLSFP